ncbi:hypothetical protein Tco_1080608 [Tanacetum coccineum]|uniref:Uncharacterized protein n=1 Tax=Tanacetum coccineum TaxID=301880 RepID=A0ABQ5HX33_9ASTR
MYYKKNLDFVAIIWEDFAYQINNRDSKKQDKMYYPRFTKAIFNHFLIKNPSISMRNRMFMHTTRDDTLLGILKFISKHEYVQVYGALLPKEMTNPKMLNSDSFKTYYAIAKGVEPPKSKKIHKKSDSAKSSNETPPKKKSIRVKRSAKISPAMSKKKAPAKADTGKGEGTNEGTGTKPGVPDVPKHDSESETESWGDSNKDDDDDDDASNNDGDDNDDDGDNSNDEGDDNDDNNDGNDNDDDEGDDNVDDDEQKEEEENVDERVPTPEDSEFSDEEDQEKEKNEEEEDDYELLYKDVNVNLREEYVNMMNADQGGAEHNISQESRFEYAEEDAHVTITNVYDSQKTEGQTQSSSVSFDFTSKLLNFENVSTANYIIALVMDTTIHQTSSTVITKTPLLPTLVIPPTQQATQTPTPTIQEPTTSVTAFPNFAFVLRFDQRVSSLEKDVSQFKQANNST